MTDNPLGACSRASARFVNTGLLKSGSMMQFASPTLLTTARALHIRAREVTEVRHRKPLSVSSAPRTASGRDTVRVTPFTQKTPCFSSR